MILNVSKIKGRMVEMGVSQEDLSALLNISRPTLNKRLNDPSGEHLTMGNVFAICRALKIDDPTQYFFCG